MVSGSHEISRLFYQVLERYVVRNFSVLCAARFFKNQQQHNQQRPLAKNRNAFQQYNLIPS